MTQISSLKQAEQVLAGYMPQTRELLGKDLTLERMKPLMARLGNPETKLKIIHVAGTSGKTSTSYYLAALLKRAGQKVGLTVSPHVSSVTERVQINLEPLGEGEFCAALSEFLSLIEEVEPKPTYFEIIIAFVYWYFAKAGVDYAVIETGLGGSFDATNIAGKSDKVCVITDIGLDHMHVLGNSLTEIAGQKAGIIHSGNQVFMHEQSPAVMGVFRQAKQYKNAILNVLSKFESSAVGELNQLPAYQQRNWSLAYVVYGFISSRDSLPKLSDQQLAESMKVQVPGRMELIKVKDKTVILDGAHNEQKMKAFVNSFQQLYPHSQVPILLGMKEGKEYEAVLRALKPICSQLLVTAFEAKQDLLVKSLKPEILAAAAAKQGYENIKQEPDSQKALQQLLTLPDNQVIITGSFYLLSSLRPSILSTND